MYLFLQRTATQLVLLVMMLSSITPLVGGQDLSLDDVLSTGKGESPRLSTCTDSEFKTMGNSATTGPAGNIRTFGSPSISTHASAFARRNSDGAWQTAFLGAYSSGLGVTDSSESGTGNSSKVENAGGFRNYILFEFDQPVVIDQVFVESISTDSDLSIWVGNAADPYNNHITLSDALLTGFGQANHNSSTTVGHWVDVNPTNEVGNVVIIAARTDSTDDNFLVDALRVNCPPPPCGTRQISSTGNDGSDGADGNIRTFTNGSLSARASAFSRQKAGSGLWETAYLGAFGTGVGVTDRSEGNGDNDRHKVDNIDSHHNYVLYEFNQDVIVNRVYLDSIGADSDITVWIGSSTDPYNNHVTLSDTFLASMGPAEDNNGGGSARWADINAAGKAGNILVVAASTSDDTPEDAFKVKLIDAECAPTNRAKVTIIKRVFALGGATATTQEFGFTATGMSTPAFELVDQDVIGPDRFVESNITAFGAGNPITVTENLSPTWTLSDLVCEEDGGINNTTVSFVNRKATIIAEPGESIVCTFTNTQLIPTAARVSVSGRATTVDGQGIGGATLTLVNAETGETRMARTNGFGYYSIDGVEVGTFYVLTIKHKRHFFAADTRSFTLLDELASVDFVEAF